MLDLDKYINNSIKIQIFGKELDVLEPTLEMVMRVDSLEKDLNEKNIHDKRVEVAHMFLNYNKQGEKISKEQIKGLPFEAIVRLIAEVSLLRYEAERNPNSKSQSQQEK